MGLKIERSNCPACGSKSISKVMDCKDYTVSDETFEIWECEDCTLRFTQNVPDEMSIGPYYQSDAYISHTDSENGLVNKMYKQARNYTLNWKLKLVEEKLGEGIKTGNLLDIGSGTGAFLNKASSAGWTVTGLEPDEGARKICFEKYALPAEPPGKLFQLSSDQFDAITMWHVLEHVHQLHEYLQEIRRVLKPGGVVLIALPNYTSRDAGKYKNFWAAYDVPRHLYHFSPKAMTLLAEKHEMELESVKPMWLDAFYIALLSEQYRNGKGNLVAAFLNGFSSNLHASKIKTACSSLVYILRRKEA